MGHQLAPVTDQAKSSSEQVSGRTPFGGVDVGVREHPSSKDGGDFISVDTIVLCFSSVNGFHVQCVTEDKTDLFLSTQVCKPVPSEHALDTNNEVFTERSDGAEKQLWIGPKVSVQKHLIFLTQNADVHVSRVQVDSAIMFVSCGIKSHGSLLGKRFV
jgi:hypothetical protein